MTIKTFVETMNVPRGGKYVSKDPPVRCHVELKIDVGMVMAKMARMALANKSKKARALGGLVAIEVTPLGET